MFYVYDGTFEGFLSAVTVVMRSEKDVSADQDKASFFGIVRDTGEPLLLDCRTVDVIPGILSDFGGYIQRHFGALMNKTIYHAFLSEVDGIETAIADYIFLARQCRIDPIDQLYRDCVKKVADAAKSVTREAHHYLGLLRFRKLKAPSHSNGLWPSTAGRISVRWNNDDERSTSTSGEKSVHFDDDVRSTPSASELLTSEMISPSSIKGKKTLLRKEKSSSLSFQGNPVIADVSTLSNTLIKVSTSLGGPLITDDSTLSNPLTMNASSLSRPLITDSSSDNPEIFVAECEPVTCSLPLIAEHFAERLPNQLFIIVDRRRNICVIHTQGDDWTIAPYESSAGMDESFDSSFESLWQTYFKVLAIPERINPKLQRGNMPKRYWKYLIEHPGKG